MPYQLLQIANLLAQRWLRHAEPRRGLAEMQRVGDGKEVAQVAQLDFAIHIQIISIRTFHLLDI
jgi:hypothetical protein